MGAICAKRTSKPVEDPTPDPVTGLTQRQRNLLKQSWQQILRKFGIKETGTRVLLKLFAKDPRLITYYHDLAYHEHISELRNKANFRAQAVSIVMRTSAYIECIDDPEILSALIYKHSFAHTGYTFHDVETLKEVFLEFVKEECGSDATPELMDAWDKLFTFHNSCFQKKSEVQNIGTISL